MSGRDRGQRGAGSSASGERTATLNRDTMYEDRVRELEVHLERTERNNERLLTMMKSQTRH